MLDGVFEAVLTEMAPPKKPTAKWQATVRDRALAFRAVLRAHPHCIPLFATRPAVTAASMAHLEAGLAVLRAAGFSIADALRIFEVLLAFVTGHAIATYSPVRPDDGKPAYEQLGEDEFPYIREMARVLAMRDLDAEFEFGLEALLTGIEARRR
jgi:hypothetical protein